VSAKGQTTTANAEDRRNCVLLHLREKHGPCTNAIGYRLRRLGLTSSVGRSKGNDILAATAVLRSLDRLGLVRASRSGNYQWAVQVWYLTEKGKEAADALARKVPS
jgi:hypothetical protein